MVLGQSAIDPQVQEDRSKKLEKVQMSFDRSQQKTKQMSQLDELEERGYNGPHNDGRQGNHRLKKNRKRKDNEDKILHI